MVGSGPFRFKADDRVQGSLYVYERFDRYRPREDGEPDFLAGPKIVYFDRVEWHINPDQGTGDVRSCCVGEYRLARGGAKTTSCRCSSRPATRAITLQRMYSAGFLWMLRPNHLHPPFNNPAMRRALLGG